ncbi:MAG: EscU/YscU/HrcU family type III secretion system export apparatus switch protein [Clostridiales bacterium]|nr:EscU/YscU/HrcU family type III secretion system export apparatus switch protein [Clostridiales bacterium]
MNSGEEKRFPATPRRREEARRRGEVARSADLSAAISLLAGVLLLKLLGGAYVLQFVAWAQGFWSRFGVGDWTVEEVQELFAQGVFMGLKLLLPLGLGLLAVALLGGVGQVGLSFNGSGLVPQFSRIDPIKGLQRLFSTRSLVELGKGLLKMALLGGLAYSSLRHLMDMLPLWLLSGPVAAAGHVAGETYGLVMKLGAAYLLVSALDYAYQRYSLEQRLRMTVREWKEELRQTEGDPQVRMRIRKRQREMALRRMLLDVKTADVVVVNPTHVAVALRYREDRDPAPRVVAKGKGALAQRLRQIAFRHGVVIMEDPPLARALYRSVRVGQVIPVELYKAVAEVLAFVWKVKGRVA